MLPKILGQQDIKLIGLVMRQQILCHAQKQQQKRNAFVRKILLQNEFMDPFRSWHIAEHNGTPHKIGGRYSKWQCEYKIKSSQSFSNASEDLSHLFEDLGSLLGHSGFFLKHGPPAEYIRRRKKK